MSVDSTAIIEMSPTLSAATAKNAGQTSGASTSTGTLLLLTVMSLESGWSSERQIRTHRLSVVAVVGHTPGQGEVVGIGQVGLDNQGRLGSFAEAVADSTRLALEAGLKR